jgi:hypothetical protein
MSKHNRRRNRRNRISNARSLVRVGNSPNETRIRLSPEGAFKVQAQERFMQQDPNAYTVPGQEKDRSARPHVAPATVEAVPEDTAFYIQYLSDGTWFLYEPQSSSRARDLQARAAEVAALKVDRPIRVARRGQNTRAVFRYN